MLTQNVRPYTENTEEKDDFPIRLRFIIQYVNIGFMNISKFNLALVRLVFAHVSFHYRSY